MDAELAAAGPASAPLDFDRYDVLARAVFRRIAVDRGRRMLVGVASGCVCVAVLKATLRRTPLVGPLFHNIVVPLLPYGAGPVLGLAACAYLPDDPAVVPWRRSSTRRAGANKPAKASRKPAAAE